MRRREIKHFKYPKEAEFHYKIQSSSSTDKKNCGGGNHEGIKKRVFSNPISIRVCFVFVFKFWVYFCVPMMVWNGENEAKNISSINTSGYIGMNKQRLQGSVLK